MSNQKNSSNPALVWTATGVLALGLLFARVVFPEYLWLSVALGVALLAAMIILVKENQAALKSRTAAYGFNSAVTIILVIAIVGVLNFLGSRYPLKADLTKNKVHTLSDQTVKLVKGLQKTVKATLYAKMQQKEQLRPLLDNYKALNPKFEVEYVDPDREPTRVKQYGIKKYGTLQLTVGARDTKIEDVNEEKLTNALIKVLKDKSPTLCAITGHGEKSFNSTEAEGYDTIKRALQGQAYEVKDVSLVEEKGKVPETCDTIAIIGPTKSFFDPEVKAVSAYLDNGGRAIIAYDANIKGGDNAPELAPVLQSWYVKPYWAIIVDPLSRMLGVDAAVPIVATYSQTNPITKDFQANTFFPFARPFDVIPNAPASLKVDEIAKTTPKSWGVTDPKQLTSGEVAYREGKDKMGPLTVAVAVSGKKPDSKAPRETRLVIFGSSNFATNNYSRFGGNLDMFVNSASWVMEDESLISIRAKEEGAGRVELSQKAGYSIFLITVLLIPLLIAVAGIVIWVRRRKL